MMSSVKLNIKKIRKLNTVTSTKFFDISKIMADYKVVTSDFVKLTISTSKDDFSFNEKRFAKDLTIQELKVCLCYFFGQSSFLI